MPYTNADKIPMHIQCCYAAFLANGIVKIGVTENLFRRFYGLRSDAKRLFNSTILSYAIATPCYSARRVERILLNRLSKDPTGKLHEWLHDIRRVDVVKELRIWSDDLIFTRYERRNAK